MKEPVERPVNIYKAGEITPADTGKKQKTIYLEVRDETGHEPVTPLILSSLLESDNFQIVDAPSKAAYILYISILQEGSVNPETMENIVRAGYGAPALFTGGDHSGWIADALLVKRRVPSEKRPSQERLKNISSRNALGSSQQRIGLSTPGTLNGRPGHVAVFGQPLARTLHAAITGKDDEMFN